MKSSITESICVEMVCEAIANHEGVLGLSYDETIRQVCEDVVVIDHLWDVWQIDLFELL